MSSVRGPKRSARTRPSCRSMARHRSRSRWGESVVRTSTAMLRKGGCATGPQGAVRYRTMLSRARRRVRRRATSSARAKAARTSPRLPPKPSAASTQDRVKFASSRARRLASRGRRDGARHRERLDMRLHVMNAQHARPRLRREHIGRDRAEQAIARRQLAGDMADERFSRQADQDGRAKLGELAEPSQEREILPSRLAEADPRIDEDALPGSPALSPRSSDRARKAFTSAMMSTVASTSLPVVHHDQARRPARHAWHPGVALQAPYVVEDRRPPHRARPARPRPSSCRSRWALRVFSPAPRRPAAPASSPHPHRPADGRGGSILRRCR